MTTHSNKNKVKYLKYWEKNAHQPKFLYSEKLFYSEREINIFSDKQKLNKFLAHRPGLQEILKKDL